MVGCLSMELTSDDPQGILRGRIVPEIRILDLQLHRDRAPPAFPA